GGARTRLERGDPAAPADTGAAVARSAPPRPGRQPARGAGGPSRGRPGGRARPPEGGGAGGPAGRPARRRRPGGAGGGGGRGAAAGAGVGGRGGRGLWIRGAESRAPRAAATGPPQPPPDPAAVRDDPVFEMVGKAVAEVGPRPPLDLLLRRAVLEARRGR